MRLRFAVLASLLTTLVAVAAPTVASAAPRHNHGLTINATPNPILAGEGVLIYGQLEGTNVTGQTIRLYHRIDPSPHFTLIGTTKTNSFGFYEFTRAEGVVLTNRNWFVTGPNGTHSRTVHEQVAAIVSLAASTSTADTKHAIVFTGHVTPNHAFQRVLLQEQNGSSDQWTTLKSGRLGPGSNYEISYRWLIPGDRDVRVVLPGDVRNTTGASDPVSVAIQQAQVADFTINSSAPIVGDGQSVKISGVLYQPGTTTPESNIVVALYRHGVYLGETTTASDGSYSFTQSPTRNQVYQVRTVLPPHRHTAQLFEGVRDVVSILPSSTTSMVGQKVTFTGGVTPDKAGDVIYLQRLGADGDWHTVKVGLVSSHSTYQFSWTFGTPGTKEFRARIVGDPENVGGASAPVTMSVSLPPVSSLPPAS
jgi:hypothetical protein